MYSRVPLARVDGNGPDGGKGVVLVYRTPDGLEIVVTEEDGGDASVVLSLTSAKQLADSLAEASVSGGDAKAEQ